MKPRTGNFRVLPRSFPLVQFGVWVSILLVTVCPVCSFSPRWEEPSATSRLRPFGGVQQGEPTHDLSFPGTGKIMFHEDTRATTANQKVKGYQGTHW